MARFAGAQNETCQNSPEVIFELRIHWRLLTILKNKQKSVWSKSFRYLKVFIFWKFIQYNIHWDKTKMLKKSPRRKVTVQKNALFFPSRVPTHHSFTFNLRFLYELKHKVCRSKVVITWSRLAGMKFCPALPGSRQCYILFINYVLWLHVKRFILARRDPSFVQPGSRFVGTKFSHVISSFRLGGIKKLIKKYA